MLLKILGFFETMLLSIFSYIIPKKKDLLLFGSMKGKYISGNPKIFYLYMQKNYPEKEMYFFDGNNINTNNKMQVYGKGIKKYWLLLRAKYLIIDACSFDLGISGVFFGNFNLIQLWHGEPIKKIGFLSELYISRRSSIVLFFEKLEYKTYKMILSNPGTKEILQGAFKNKNVKNIGVPRNDMLLFDNILQENKNIKIEEYLQKQKKYYQRIFLLAPTFREENSDNYFSTEELKILQRTLENKNYLLIIKTHINETRKFLDKKYNNIKNITEILHFDSTDFLPFIDGVVTDYSSIYIDFLLTNKPVIFYQNDLENYIHKERGLLYSPKKVTISVSTAYDINNFIKILENIDLISQTEQYKKEYKELYNLFYKGLNKQTSSCEQLYNLLY